MPNSPGRSGTRMEVAPGSKPKSRRLHQLDGLRALAVCMVVFVHSFAGPLQERLGGRLGQFIPYAATSGVDLFFVLSGIVLLRPFVRQQRPFQTKRYLLRRIERLWPPYLAALMLASAVIFVTTARPTWYSRAVLPRFSLSSLFAQIGIVNLGWTTYNGAWWSLSPEIIFYLIAPFAVLGMFLLGVGRLRVITGVAGTAVASLVVVNLANISSASTIYLFGAFLPCFAVGCMLARFDIGRRIGWCMLGGGLLYVLAAFEIPRLNDHIGFAALYGGLVVVALAGGRVGTSLAQPLAVWLGERSYALFLMHFSVFYLVDYLLSFEVGHRTTLYVIFSRGLGIPLALFISMVLFTTVERRFARGLVTAGAFWPWQRTEGLQKGVKLRAAG